MATVKLSSGPKPIYNIKLLAEKSVVMVECDGFESEIFIPSIVKGRISFLNVIANRRCCNNTSRKKEKNKTTDNNTIKRSTSRFRSRTIDSPRIVAGQESNKREQAGKNSVLLNKGNGSECSSKVSLRKKQLSYIKEKAKIAEEFRNAVATRRQALALALNKDIANADLKKKPLLEFGPIASKLYSSNNISPRIPAIPETTDDLKASNTEQKTNEGVKQNNLKSNAVLKCIRKRGNIHISHKGSSGHRLKNLHNSNIMKRKESDKKISQDSKSNKKFLLRKRSFIIKKKNSVLFDSLDAVSSGSFH